MDRNLIGTSGVHLDLPFSSDADPSILSSEASAHTDGDGAAK
jgi:hypothetical protein